MYESQHRGGTGVAAHSGYIRLQGVSAGYDESYWAQHDSFHIGRGDDQEVVLKDKSVSRCHADVNLTDQGWMLRDHHSTNGTYVNGERLDQAAVNLQQGDVVRCGRVVLYVPDLVEGLPGEGDTPVWRADEDHDADPKKPGDSAARTHIRLSHRIGAKGSNRN